MNINELDSYNLADAVKFHRRLNPRIWGRDEHLLPEVREKLLAIAEDFQEFLGVEDLDVQDITISGSNAAYSYTKNSDIDLHLVVTMPDNPVYQELFNAKKYQYNDEHNIKIGGADVELYVQPSEQAHHSQGIYSIKNNEWKQIPQRKRAQVDDACVRDKTADLDSRIHAAVKSKNIEAMSTLWDKIKAMRKSGLEQHGEFGCENISFKMLRNSGCIKLLKDAITSAQDRELSLREAGKTQPRFRYGFSEGHQGQPYSSEDGVAASTKQFLEDSSPDNNLVHEFIQHVAMELGIDPLPEIHLHTDPEWSTHNHSFGRYDPDSHTLNVSMPNRHILDVLRTVAHELVHCSQNQQHNGLPDDAGETGSRWENDANARAGIIMRDWANSHPEHFEFPALEESASGYIPKNKREAAMPQYAMALSVDIKPGEVGRQANKLSLKTGRNGEPGLLQPDAQNLLREFAEFTEEQENLFEISMSPTSLKKLSAQTGALAGMEFEMCVPNTEGGDDNGDQEPDYEYDERCRSIDDAVQFFHDGDWNGRRDVERLRERMQNDYQEWLDDKIYQDWERSGEEYLEEWVPNNVDESEWNPDGLEGDERQEALEEFIANMHADPGSSDAFDEFREENQDSYDESDWLDAEDLDLMSYVENAYDVTWPHWSSVGSGETSIEDVADSFSNAVGRPVQASGSYHSGSVQRPSTKNPHYLVEPDSSIDVDDRDDRGLEFVSPPLPIEELLSDLNKVKAWADRTGCYTNDSTGLHINVSVPGWTAGSNQLDYVKLAVLLGDEHVLESFGRAGNTYCKSAMGKIQSIIRQNPAKAEEMLERMRQGMDQLASKAIHSGTTDKYTSINNKNGYIEFRSPGGDWLNDNFAEIDNTLRRFTVAMSAAVDPEAYRKEYLKKLYKLLDVSSEKDPLSYFAKYAAGELPKAALKSFVRQAQLQRGVTRGKDTRPMWWRVYKEGKDARNSAVIEVVASSKEEALDKAAKDWGVFSDEYRRAMYAEPVRPYKQEGRLVTLTGRPSNPDGNYVIVNAATQAPAYRYMASDMTDATLVLRQWITANPGTQWDFKRDPEMRLGQPGQQQPQGVDTRVDYELYSRASGAVIDTFPARNDDEARIRLDDYRQHGAGQSNPDNFDVRRAGRAAAPAAQQQDDVTPFEIYNRDTGAVVSTVMARTAQEALAELDQFRAEQVRAQGITIPRANALYGVQHAPIPGSTIDLQRQRAAAAQDQQQGGTIDVATDQPTPQPAGMGQWNGQWKVLVNGQEVYRFGNIGNSQADANRIAAAWLRQNGQGVSGEGFEVYPVMAESLREYKMPQPSHGPGKYRDLNEPLGPETPPEMPDGTIKVDVSDMYDWYKLGQKISDLDSIKPGELGSGPPSTVFAFGSEDLENQYSHALTRLGLKTHDLDEPGEEDLDESTGHYKIHDTEKLDGVLAKCCRMIERGQQKDPERYGMVAACIIDPDNRHVYGINLPGPRGTRRHAERVAIDKYKKQHGDIPEGSIVVTTLSPCNSPMDERAGESCKDLLNSQGIHKVYCGYVDPTQHDDTDAGFVTGLTQNDALWESCKAFADTFLHEDDLEEGWKSALAGAGAAAAMAFTPAPANSTAAPTVNPAAQPAAVQQTPGAAAESALTRAAKAAGINGVELAQFLAQCAHESGDFSHMEELGGNKYLAKYDPTVNPTKAKALGNTQAGDGAKYKGRGFIQITGKANYANAGQALGIDLVNNPEAAARPDVAAKIAVWYWQNRVAPYVQNFSDTRSVTKRINPGLQGLQDRADNFKDYQQQMAVVAPAAKVAAAPQAQVRPAA